MSAAQPSTFIYNKSILGAVLCLSTYANSYAAEAHFPSSRQTTNAVIDGMKVLRYINNKIVDYGSVILSNLMKNADTRQSVIQWIIEYVLIPSKHRTTMYGNLQWMQSPVLHEQDGLFISLSRVLLAHCAQYMYHISKKITNMEDKARLLFP